MLKYATTATAREFCYVEFGDALLPTLILLHGWSADLSTWAYLMMPLSKHYHVFALDFPGHGRSCPQIEGADSLFLVKWLREVTNTLDISRFHLLGHSMGGQVAAEYARLFPDCVESLTLLAPAGVGFPVNLEAVKQSGGSSSCMERAEAQRRLLANSRLDAFEFPWHELACPLKLIWGAEDRVVPAPLAGQLPEICHLHLLPGVGHAPHQEVPSEVLSLLTSRSL